jgi:putative ABC transport system permease protein
LARGRAFGAEDDPAGSIAVVVNEAAAATLWPGENPIGRQLERRSDDGRQSTPLEVIGVVGPAPYEGPTPDAMVYAPLSTASSGWDSKIAVRTTGDARAFLPELRAAVREVEPYAALGDIATLAEQYESQRREAVESNAGAFAVGIAALLLASLGLYAIIAFAVAQRTREIGVRLAMGASPARVVRHFFRDGVRVSAIGLAIGLPATVIGIRVVKASVLGFTIHSAASVIVVVPVLIAVAAVASWLPARRAGRVDPLIALRAE